MGRPRKYQTKAEQVWAKAEKMKAINRKNYYGTKILKINTKEAPRVFKYDKKEKRLKEK